MVVSNLESVIRPANARPPLGVAACRFIKSAALAAVAAAWLLHVDVGTHTGTRG